LISASDVTSIGLMKNSSKLYYIDQEYDQIRVIDLNETNPKSNLVIHWTSYNNLLRTLAVSGGYVFWTERTYDAHAVLDQYSWGLEAGKIRNGVVTRNNTWSMDYRRGYHTRNAVYQLVAFEHNFPPQKPSTPHTNSNRVTTVATTTASSHASLPLISWEIMLFAFVSAIVKLVNV
ncbi:Hypothetical predicted protein, partial [Paramuricea clavata]